MQNTLKTVMAAAAISVIPLSAQAEAPEFTPEEITSIRLAIQFENCLALNTRQHPNHTEAVNSFCETETGVTDETSLALEIELEEKYGEEQLWDMLVDLFETPELDSITTPDFRP